MPADRRWRRPGAAAGIGLLVVLWLAAGTALAERMVRFGAYEAHYSLVPTTMLKPAIATRYDLTRARDRALLNVSVLDGNDAPVRAKVSGVVRDLLGQTSDIAFREVAEGEAVYYLAEIRHGDQDVLRFAIDVETPDGMVHELAFQQKLYWGTP